MPHRNFLAYLLTYLSEIVGFVIIIVIIILDAFWPIAVVLLLATNTTVQIVCFSVLQAKKK